MDKLKRIETYIFDFFSSRFELIDIFFWTTHRDRHTGIYMLKDGPQIMDFFIYIHSSIENQYFHKQLVPNKFATPDALFREMDSFKNYLNKNQKLLDKNFKGDNTFYVVHDLQKLKDELIEMITYTKQLYDNDDSALPYQKLRQELILRNIPEFINLLKSILASVSYGINKTQEGYYHSNVYLILKLLGFEIISEEMTNLGRIDAVVRFVDTVYIVEFKFNSVNDDDLSEKAVQQIIATKYHEKFIIEQKEIFGIGVSFSKKTRNINGYKFAEIHT